MATTTAIWCNYNLYNRYTARSLQFLEENSSLTPKSIFVGQLSMSNKGLLGNDSNVGWGREFYIYTIN